MASLRQLPSGNWQAAVLLDNGRRITRTAPTMKEAASWAQETEEKRDKERAARRDVGSEQSIAVHVAAIERYARDGLLSEERRNELRRIIEL